MLKMSNTSHTAPGSSPVSLLPSLSSPPYHRCLSDALMSSQVPQAFNTDGQVSQETTVKWEAEDTGRMSCRTLACLWPQQPDHQLKDDEAEQDHDQGSQGPTHEQIARVDAKLKLQLDLFVCSTSSHPVSFVNIPPVVYKPIDTGITPKYQQILHL